MWELYCEESRVPKNWCFWTVVLEKSLESPLDCKEIQPIHPKGDQSWVFIGRTDAEAEAIWWDKLTHWRRPWCWARLKAGGEGDNRGWDGWMASPTGWTWVWVSSRSWRWTGKPGCYSRWFYKASDMDWRLNSHMRVYVLECHSPTSSLPLFGEVYNLYRLTTREHTQACAISDT